MNNWEAETKAGRDLAETCVEEMKATRNPASLMQFVRSTVSRGTITAIEVGFFYYIAKLLIRR